MEEIKRNLSIWLKADVEENLRGKGSTQRLFAVVATQSKQKCPAAFQTTRAGKGASELTKT